MIRTFLVIGAVAFVGACDFPSMRPSEPAVAPVAEAGAPDQCGATAMKYLVGKPRTEIPSSGDATKRRVTCNTCPVTRDYRPDRLNIFYEAQTGIVTDVNCG